VASDKCVLARSITILYDETVKDGAPDWATDSRGASSKMRGFLAPLRMTTFIFGDVALSDDVVPGEQRLRPREWLSRSLRGGFAGLRVRLGCR
jgi:hypothetical protein